MATGVGNSISHRLRSVHPLLRSFTMQPTEKDAKSTGANSILPASANGSKETAESLPCLSILQEDDEFEEFDVEDWKVDADMMAKLEVEKWEEDWDDDFGAQRAESDEFGRQLREEIARASQQLQQASAQKAQ